MDGLAELIPLLLVGAYYLLQGRRRAAQRRAQQGATAAPSGGREAADEAPSPFQAFVQQIEDAMAEASGESRTPSHPEPVEHTDTSTALPPPVVTTPPPARPREFRAPAGSFVSTAPTDHAVHGFGTANPFSEESFERRPAFGPRPRTTATAYDPHGLHRAEPPAPPRSSWHATLRDPKAARDAFVLQTVFGARGGRRNDPR